MKKTISVLLLISVILGVCACGPKTDPAGPTDIDPLEADPTAKLSLSFDELPVIDGATAMLPYYSEMVARITGSTIEEANAHVLCSTTTFAYDNLRQGEVDMVFCAPPSEEQIEEAKNEGVTYESVQVLNSGFVFFVNKSNPVDSITASQLYDIYAGKITNWKELGGTDEPILAYQREEGSGSQSGLYQHLISKDEVMDAPMEYKLGAMADIIDAVAVYDNASGAIGYSYYYYITNMHYQEDVKLLAVDNIYPTNETISSGMYPFISKTAVYFNSNEPEDSVVRKIAAWCSSAAGDKLALDLGYVPSKDAKTVFPSYASVAPTQPKAYKLTKNKLTIDPIYEGASEDGYSNYQYISIIGLKDKSVEDKINKAIKAKYDEIKTSQYIPHYIGAAVKEGEISCQSLYTTSFANVNNILSMVFTGYYSSEDYYLSYMHEYCMTFDLNTGNELTLTDIVGKGSGLDYLNSQVIKKASALDDGAYYDYNSIIFKAPFTGLKEDQKFVLDSSGLLCLIFDDDTPEIYPESYPKEISVCVQGYVDFEKYMHGTSLFEDETPEYLLAVQQHELGEINRALDESYFGERNIYVMYSASGYKDIDDRINKILIGDRDKAFKFADLAKEKYDLFEKGGCNPSGDVEVITYLNHYGRYMTAYEAYSYGIYARNNDTYHDVVENDSMSYVFTEESSEPLGIADLFKDKENYKQVLFNAVLNKMTAKGEYTYIDYVTGETKIINPNDENLRSFIKEALENIKCFEISDEYLELRIDKINDIEAKYLDTNEIDYHEYSSLVTMFYYTAIGYDNLVIFD